MKKEQAADYDTIIETEWEGAPAYLAALREITEHKQVKNDLKNTAQKLKQTVEDLKMANQTILDQQKSVIEEERLKVLLQMAGATAHALNQPLATLLGNIELMRIKKDDPEKLAQYMRRIEETGERIALIVKKIQDIRHAETRPYADGSTIISLDQKLNILLVDDMEDDFQKISTILKNEPQINLSQAGSIGEAMETLKKGPFDVILLEHALPDGSSLDFLEAMGNYGLGTPVVIVTNRGSETIASQTIQAGACDYLLKVNASKTSLLRSIKNATEKSRLKREVNIALQKMAEMATRDELTGLYNRRFFSEALEREVARAKRYGTGLVVLMMDLDHFKEVNDTYGHSAGDMVLHEIARMLLGSIRQSDLICRYGGEEFAVILPNIDLEKARWVSERFRKKVSKHQFEYDLLRFQITVSIGIAPFDSSRNRSPIDLINGADQALYEAKRKGRNRVKAASCG